MPLNIPKPPRVPEPPPTPRETPEDTLGPKELVQEPAEDTSKLTKEPVSRKSLGRITKEIIFGPKRKHPLPHKKPREEDGNKDIKEKKQPSPFDVLFGMRPKEKAVPKEPPPYMLKGGYIATDKLRWEVQKSEFHKTHPTSPEIRKKLIEKWFGNTQVVNPKSIEPVRKKIDIERKSTSWSDGKKRKELEMEKKFYDDLFPPLKRP